MIKQKIKQAHQCESMRDVRAGIDSLDEKLLILLSERIQYIKRAAQIKTSIDSIRDDERIESIISKRKSQAGEHGYSEEFIENLFRQLIEYSVDFEMQTFKNDHRL